MTPRLRAVSVTAALSLGVAGSGSAGVLTPETSGPILIGDATKQATPGTWDKTYTYAVNGKRRTCTLTRGAKCVGANLRGKVKHHGDLRKANLRRADLRFADLRGANLQGADLRSANLKYADLRGANLKGAKFQYAPPVHGKKAKRGNQAPSCFPNCQGANLVGANLTDAYLYGANLVGANLTDANLTWANLYGANLYGANLANAILQSANLTDANLSWANLTDANLSWANLTDASLAGANLGGVTWNTTTCRNGNVTNTGCPT